MKLNTNTIRYWLTFLTLLVPLSVVSGDEDGWPQWRGPHRTGVIGAENLIDAWPEGGLDQIWRIALGNGFSTITATNDTLFTMRVTGEGEERTESVVAIAADTGQIQWEFTVGKAFTDQFGDGPRATATLANGMVYTLGSYGRLVALSQADGNLVWDVDFTKVFESDVPRWGFSCSPLVDNGLVFVEAGGGEGEAIAALDAKTGATQWTALDGAASYSSPIAITVDGTRQYVFAGRGQLVALDASGKQLWNTEWKGGTIATPIFMPPNRIFVSAGDDNGAMLVQINNLESETPVETIWASRVMKNHINASVLIDGYLYGFDNATLKCIDAETGEMKWRTRGYGKGSLIGVGDYLFVLSDRGKLAQAKASPDGFKPIGTMQALTGKSWTSPTLIHGRIYLRNHDELACFQVGKTNVDSAKPLQ